MKILVDADSCPKGARELILRQAARLKIPAFFAANRPIPGVEGENAIMEVCPPGEGTADNRIVELAEPGDLAVTRDVPLALRLVEKNIAVLDDRGTVSSRENIRERLSLRDFAVGLAQNGMDVERKPSWGPKERARFANALDRVLGRLLREGAVRNPSCP